MKCSQQLTGGNKKSNCNCCPACCESADCRTGTHKAFKEQRELKHKGQIGEKKKGNEKKTEKKQNEKEDGNKAEVGDENVFSDDYFWDLLDSGEDIDHILSNEKFTKAFYERQQNALNLLEQRKAQAPLSQEDAKTEKKIRTRIEDSNEVGSITYLMENLLKKTVDIVRRLEVLEEFVPTQPISGECTIRQDPHIANLTARLEALEREKKVSPTMPSVGSGGLQEQKRMREQEKRLGEIEKTEISKSKTACDTAFRQKYKKVIEKYFHIHEYGEQEVVVRNREGGEILARKIQGVVYGDGGAYIECNQEDIEKKSFQETEKRVFFDFLYTSDKCVRAYFQKKDVRGQPNPPKEAKYRDPNNRAEGYAKYKVGKSTLRPTRWKS